MNSRHGHSWQLILADLALILFLLTLTALASEEATADADQETSEDNYSPVPQVAASQALFRSSPLGPTLAQWLAERPFDPRATLTIFAQHSGDDAAAMWERSHALANSAADNGFAVRVVITESGEGESDLYASLAYDRPSDE